MFLQHAGPTGQQYHSVFTARLYPGHLLSDRFPSGPPPAEKLQEMIDSLKVGDKVVTSGGIYGTIVGLKDDRIQLRVAENVKIELSRNAVTALQGSEQE